MKVDTRLAWTRGAVELYATRYDDGDLRGYWVSVNDAHGTSLKDGFVPSLAEVRAYAKQYDLALNVERRTR